MLRSSMRKQAVRKQNLPITWTMLICEGCGRSALKLRCSSAASERRLVMVCAHDITSLRPCHGARLLARGNHDTAEQLGSVPTDVTLMFVYVSIVI